MPVLQHPSAFGSQLANHHPVERHMHPQLLCQEVRESEHHLQIEFRIRNVTEDATHALTESSIAFCNVKPDTLT